MVLDLQKCQNFSDLLLLRLEETADLPALSYPVYSSGRRIPAQLAAVESLTWQQLVGKLSQVAQELCQRGFKPGDRLAFYLTTNYQFMLLDMAVLAMGGISVPIYETTPVPEMIEILKEQKPRFLFLKNSGGLSDTVNSLDELDFLKGIIVKKKPDGLENSKVFIFDDLLQGSENLDLFRKGQSTVSMQDLACFYHTSGTQGRQKPVPLSHGNLLAEVRPLVEIFGERFNEDDQALSMLPYSHIFGRVEELCFVALGCQGFRMDGVEELGAYFKRVKPSLLFTVPRVLEKIRSGILAQVETLPIWSRKLAQLVLGKMESDEDSDGFLGHFKHALVVNNIRENLGGHLKTLVSAGAPLSKELGQFFRGLDIEILQAYGLTETAGVISITQGQKRQLGTVGKPLPGIDIQIAADGEVRVKGGCVFSGYGADLSQVKATDPPFKQGYFCTGDLGRWDEANNLQIIGRKKDLIVTSGGKKVAPQKIEALLGQHALIDQAIVLGNDRPFIIALLALDEETLQADPSLRQTLRESNWVDSSIVKKRVSEVIQGVNRTLAPFERVKKFIILKTPLSPESGELTLSLKPKRFLIEKNFRDEIQALYQRG